MRPALRVLASRFRPAYRTAFLALLGIIGIIYGAGVITASGSTPGSIHWWPGSAARLAGVPILTWGIIWCCTGSFLLGSLWSLPRRDYIQFAAAAALNGAWSVLAVMAAASTGEPGAWAPAAIYAGICAAILIISAWPEPPRYPDTGQVIARAEEAAAGGDDE